VNEKSTDHQTFPPGFDLTAKQRAFADAYIETGGNAAEAADLAYDCTNPDSPRVIACHNLQNPKIRAYLDYRLWQHEVPDEAVESLKKSLFATKPQRINGKVRMVPDETARAKARVQAFKLMGFDLK